MQEYIDHIVRNVKACYYLQLSCAITNHKQFQKKNRIRRRSRSQTVKRREKEKITESTESIGEGAVGAHAVFLKCQ